MFKPKLVLILFSVIILSCAKRGSITGGFKDTLAPVLKYSIPENFNKNFSKKDITLFFDEFVVLKNKSKQLIISPPMKNEVVISPSVASRYLKIKIADTLEPNTTYSFNFGQSITDFNEGNPLNQFKYVFSTGDYIDSLKIKGIVRPAYARKKESSISVMLYEINEKFNDSVIFKQKPIYLTVTQDTLQKFEIENLKSGKYLLIALNDEAKDNIYSANSDKIAFYKNIITLPSDSIYDLRLFSEIKPFKIKRPFIASKNRFVLPYEGKLDLEKSKLNVVLTNYVDTLETIVTKFPKKDSLQIWYKPQVTDSLKLIVNQTDDNKDFVMKLRKAKIDTMNIESLQKGTLHLASRFALSSATPIVKIDSTKIKIIQTKDTLVSYKTDYDVFNQYVYVDFKKTPGRKYTLEFLPGALTDFFEKSNDTLRYTLTTEKKEFYGNLTVKLQNAKSFPLIVELIDKSEKIVASQYLEQNKDLVFEDLEPSKLTIRVIYDYNKNKEWDTGNYLEKIEPEEVIYFPKIIEIRANWEIEQLFDLGIPQDFSEEKPKKQTKPKTRSE